MLNHIKTSLSIFSFAAGLLFISSLMPAFADSETSGHGGHGDHGSKGVMVKDQWSRPAPPVAVNGAAYVIVHNMGSKADRLVGASSDISETVELHDHVMDNGLMKMVHIEEGVTVAAGEMVEFKPGGKHLMLLGLNKPLVEGESFQLILNFEKAGEKTMTVPIQEKAMKSDHSGHTME